MAAGADDEEELFNEFAIPLDEDDDDDLLPPPAPATKHAAGNNARAAGEQQSGVCDRLLMRQTLLPFM